MVALDGKTPASVLRPSRMQFTSCIWVNAWAAEQRLVLGQLAVADKSNEITAMHCQRQVA